MLTGGNIAGIEQEDLTALFLMFIGVVSSNITTLPVTRSTLWKVNFRLNGLSAYSVSNISYIFELSKNEFFQKGANTIHDHVLQKLVGGYFKYIDSRYSIASLSLPFS